MERHKIFYFMTAVLIVVGIVSYVYSSNKRPDIPNRIMFYSMGGNVFFSHKLHTSQDGYGLDCHTCHHTWDEKDRSDPPSCTACHPKVSETEMKKSDAMHKQCIGCHEDVGNSPVKCSECHLFY